MIVTWYGMVVSYWPRRLIFASVVFFQAEDGIRYLVRSRGLGDVYKRQGLYGAFRLANAAIDAFFRVNHQEVLAFVEAVHRTCLLYTSDAADERSSVDLGGRRIIKKKNRGSAAARRREEK